VRIALAAGTHTVDVDAPGRAPLHESILIERGETREVTLVPPRAGDVPTGFVYIPAGHFLFGSGADEDTRINFYTTAPLHDRSTPAFLIARDEVTFADWLAYVDAQPPAARAALLPNLPVRAGNGVVVEAGPAGWELTLQPVTATYHARAGEPIRYEGRDRRAVQRWERFPVMGVSALEVVAYAAWLDRTGRLPGARVCGEVEWERAARGADGRESPNGRPLADDDANVDLTYTRALMGPDEIGSHPTSRSPYGLDDTSGNVIEWTRAEHDQGFVARGGGYFYDRKVANLANRFSLVADYREATLGVRMCAAAPPG
jgi:formylglycine-generating enzyme required for sulfatase activity